MSTKLRVCFMFALKCLLNVLGVLRPSARYGAIPKVAVAVVIGYFFGKFSYQQKCAEKLMQLPNSQIGEMLRQRRKGMYRER